MNTNWIVIQTPRQVTSSNQFWEELLDLLDMNWLWSTTIVDKLKDLLEAKTSDNKWNEITDNKVQLDALKLLLKLKWIKLNSSININLFSIPWKDEELRY